MAFAGYHKSGKGLQQILLESTEKMSEAIEDHSTDHGIYEMISNLPDKYKILLILRYQEGLTYKEIGDILHRKTSTVSAQIQKAKEILKSQLLS